MAILKNIIFDLGAVLINIDYKKTEKAFIALGFSQFSTMYNQYEANVLFENLETGTISNEEFYTAILSIAPTTITKAQVKHAWNEILLNWRVKSISFLQTLTPQYNLYLLSNTNAIHQAQFLHTLPLQTNITNFNALFTKAYYSHEIKLRKPNKNIFEFVINDANILPEQTLFIDDSYNNINTANALGFNTHLLLPNETIEELAIFN